MLESMVLDRMQTGEIRVKLEDTANQDHNWGIYTKLQKPWGN